MYVPLGVFAATVTIPSASILNGPVVNTVTLVLVVVAAIPLNVSLVKAFNAVTTAFVDATVTVGSFTASIGLATTTVAVAVSQSNPLGATSHIW